MSECTDPRIGRLLFAFELQVLSEEDADIFAQHVLECDQCYRELTHFANIPALIKEDADVGEMLARAADRPDAPGPLAARIWRHLWPRAPLIFKPAIAYLVVLLLIIPSYHGVWRQDRVSVQEVSQTLELFPSRQPSSNELIKSRGDVVLLRFEIPSFEAGAIYHVVIETEDGTSAIYDNRRFANTDELTRSGALYLYLGEIESGRYRLSITDPRAGPSVKPHVYHFVIGD